MEAYNFALRAHSGQKRVSGESYIVHPLGVAKILAELELDPVTIVAGILHDVVEDTEVTIEDLEKEFGSEISLLVDGVTKLSRLEFKTKEEQQAETLRKMFLAMAQDIRVILIKLADRTHNLRTLRHLHTDKQKEIARETLDIYAPLAHRLGIYKIKGEMEDLSFRYLQQEKYYELVDKLAKKRREREEFINQAIKVLRSNLERVNIPSEIQGRPKHLFSIYMKMKQQNKKLSEIYDLTAIRIIVDTIKDCYGALGVVHTIWRPIPGRFKDFIAMPKPNMYQSLHTTVVGAENELIEIQIRTWDMHRTAEYGIAAHWYYKEKLKGEDQEFIKKLSWLRQLLEWQQDSRDALEFVENIKLDLFTDEVFVFTPKGDVIDLPSGAIPLDFAYRIHTDIGNRCVGCRVSGRLVPLDYILKTGDIVEVITSKQGAPSRDWLKMVKTSTARNRIRAWFKKERREENIEKGRELLEKELRRQRTDSSPLLKESLIKDVGIRFNIHTADDLYAAVGYGGVSTNQVISRLKEEYAKRHGSDEELVLPESGKRVRKTPHGSQGVWIHGLDNILTRFARCCNPVPGDDIQGVVTVGRGISVHRKDCINIRGDRIAPERLVDASWMEVPDALYPVEIEISAADRPKLLSDIVSSISENRINITAVKGKTDRNYISTINLTLMVKDYNHLQQVINNIKKVEDVITVRRHTSA
ncbi:MAG: bifunctional (p)ppGpp synthetase/guanosine-3',5'-bis(diphosphate) 3'-pyrophosphohydrolase [Dethiobacteria bacterium]